MLRLKSCVLDWERTGNALTITNGAVDKTDEADRIERKSAESSRNGGLERDADVGWREKWGSWGAGEVRIVRSGSMRSEEWGAGECGVQRKDGACWRSLSTIAESGEATGEEFDFWLCCWAARVRPRRTFVVRAVEGLFCCRRFVLFCCFFLFLFFSLACVSASCSWHLLSFCCCFFFSPRGRGVFVGGGVCNDHGLGPGLEAGPRLDKRGSPRGLLQLVVSWSLLVVCGC